MVPSRPRVNRLLARVRHGPIPAPSATPSRLTYGDLLLDLYAVMGPRRLLAVKWASAHPHWRVNAADPGFTATICGRMPSPLAGSR